MMKLVDALHIKDDKREREKRKTNEKIKKKTWNHRQFAKPPTPSWEIDALIGSGKQKKEEKERNRKLAFIPATLDHLVASYHLIIR